LILALCAAALFGGVIVAQASLNSGNPKQNLTNPEAGMTEAQRQAYQQAVQQQAQDANNKFLLDFQAKHGNLRSLPIIKVETFAAPPLSLGAASSSSTAIVVGTVSAVSFAANPSGGMPLATVTFAVERTIKGAVSGTLTVRQLGGPVAQGSTGALAEFDTDRLLIPGDHVLLMLTRDSRGMLRTEPGAGISSIDAKGRLVPENSNAFGATIRGHTVDEFAGLAAVGT